MEAENPKNQKEAEGAQTDSARQKPPDEPKPPSNTYAQVLLKTSKEEDAIKIERKHAMIKNGVPVITFSMEEVKKSTKPLKWTLIGIFGRLRPNIDDMRKMINCDWGLKSNVEASIIDQRHVLIRFTSEADFMKVWTKENHVIKGIRFHVIQWTIDFDPSKESSKQATWIQIPKLPANFFHEDFIASIATGVGKYITCDNPTRTMSRAHGARVCVEIDLLKERTRELVVEWGTNRRVFEVIYENIPEFCRTCCVRGHREDGCKTRGIIQKTDIKQVHRELITENRIIVNGDKGISQQERTNYKAGNETTKSWVTRVFYSKVKKPVWRVKKINKQSADKLKEVFEEVTSTGTVAATPKAQDKVQAQTDGGSPKATTATQVNMDTLIVLDASTDNNIVKDMGTHKQQTPIETHKDKVTPLLEKLCDEPTKCIIGSKSDFKKKEVCTDNKAYKSADQEMRKKSELTQPKVVPISEMVEATTEVSSDSGDSVEFYDAYLLHRITDPACTFADWKKMQNENFQEVISKKNRKKKTREKEDSISDSEYYDDENCTLADWKKVISKKNKKRLKAREKENSMLEQRDERQKRTIRKPARLID